MRSKKGMELEMLGWIILAIAALAIILVAVFYLGDNGKNSIDFIKNIFRFK